MIKGRSHDVRTYGEQEVRIKYTIEYIDNERDWNVMCSNKHPAPWELYQKIDTYDLQDAIETFLVKYTSDKVFEARMWEDVSIDGDTVRETFIDTVEHIALIREQDARNIKSDNIRLTIENESLENENELFREYLRQFADGIDRFYEFCDSKKG